MFDKAEQVFKKLLSTVENTINRNNQTTVLDNFERVNGYQINVLENLGQIYRKRGKLDEAERIFKKSLALAEQLESYRDQASAHYNLGQVYRTQGKFIEAELSLKKELNIHQQRNNLKRQSNSWCNLGIIYRDSKKFEEAEQAHKKSQAIRDELNSNSGTNWHKLGLVYNDQGKLNEAEQAFKKALNIYEKRKYVPCLVKEWSNLARVYWRQRKFKEAGLAFEKSLLFAGQLDGTSLSRFYTDIFCDLGHTCIELGKLDQAGQILKRILKAKKHISEIFGQAIYLAKMGVLYEGTGNIQQAIVYTEKALEIFNRLGNTPKIEMAQETLGRLQRKNPKK